MVSSGAVTRGGVISLGEYSVRTFHIIMTREMFPVSTLVLWSVDLLGHITSHQLTFPVYKSMVSQFMKTSSLEFFLF